MLDPNKDATRLRDHKLEISNNTGKDAKIWAMFEAHQQQNGADRSSHYEEFAEEGQGGSISTPFNYLVGWWTVNDYKVKTV